MFALQLMRVARILWQITLGVRKEKREREREREKGGEETHRIALQLGREIALSTGGDPAKGWTADSWPDDRETISFAWSVT